MRRRDRHQDVDLPQLVKHRLHTLDRLTVRRGAAFPQVNANRSQPLFLWNHICGKDTLVLEGLIPIESRVCSIRKGCVALRQAGAKGLVPFRISAACKGFLVRHLFDARRDGNQRCDRPGRRIPIPSRLFRLRGHRHRRAPHGQDSFLRRDIARAILTRQSAHGPFVDHRAVPKRLGAGKGEFSRSCLRWPPLNPVLLCAQIQLFVLRGLRKELLFQPVHRRRQGIDLPGQHPQADADVGRIVRRISGELFKGPLHTAQNFFICLHHMSPRSLPRRLPRRAVSAQ